MPKKKTDGINEDSNFFFIEWGFKLKNFIYSHYNIGMDFHYWQKNYCQSYKL